MHKVFQWVREKRQSSIRKWQSSSAFSNNQSNDLDLLRDFDQFVATSNPSLNNSDGIKRTYSVLHNNGKETPKTKRRNQTAKKETSKPSSKSFRSFPPVPIPKKSRRCQEKVLAGPTTSATQALLQVPDLKREGSWKKLKRRLTSSKRKPEVKVFDDKLDQLEVKPEVGSSGANTLRDVDSIQSTNPSPMNESHRKEIFSLIVEPSTEKDKEELNKHLIEEESSMTQFLNETRHPSVSAAYENPVVCTMEEVTECFPRFVKHTPEASSTAFNLSSSSSSIEEQEPYIQLLDVDNTSIDESAELTDLEDKDITADRALPPAYPLMDVAMTQSAYTEVNERPRLPAGSTSVKATRRLRFKVPQASVCSVDSFRGIDQSRANSMNDMSSAGHSSSTTNLNHGSEIGISSLQDRRVTLQGMEYHNDNNLSPTSRPTTLDRTIASTPSSPTPSPMAPRRGMTDIERRRASLAIRRQSNVQLVQKVCGRRTSTTLIPLTSAQIHLVRSLWRQIYLTKGPTVIGTTVMHRLFFKCPKLKEQFRHCPMPRCFNNHDSFSKSHCKSMAELVDRVVENLDDLENVSMELQRVGKMHAQLLSGQLSSKLWNSVAETFIDCTLEWGDRRCRSETVRKAWALIIAFMVEKIKHGHLEERKQLHMMRTTLAGLEKVAIGSPSTPKVTANIKI